jgi:excisionase family DNA binding protein
MVNPQKEWLGLGETAEFLGVHPSTVRAWADRGDLPVHRTAGGHRRFYRSEIELWAETRRSAQPSDVEMIIQNAIGRTRIEVAEGHLEDQGWYQKLDPRHRRSYRAESHRMMREIMSCVKMDVAQSKTHALQLGEEYVHLGRRTGLSLLEMVEAFLFFRGLLMDSLFKLYESSGVRSTPAWSKIRQRFSQFMDQVLLVIIEQHSNSVRSK